jgi:hypothetical protein
MQTYWKNPRENTIDVNKTNGKNSLVKTNRFAQKGLVKKLAQTRP